MTAGRASRYQGIIGIAVLIALASLPLGFYAGGARISLYNPNFRTWDNLVNVMEQVSITGVLAVGQTFVILSGGIDLSVGSGVAFLSCVAALMAAHGAPGLEIVAVTLAAGAGIGALTGTLIVRTRMEPFIVTLAMMVSLRGLASIATHSTVVTGIGDALAFLRHAFLAPIPPLLGPVLGTQTVWNRVPVLALLLLAAVAAAQLTLARTRFGRYVVSIGGNAESARLSGVPVGRAKTAVYALNGLMVGLAALMYLARTQAGEPSSGIGYELDAIAAVVVGGTALMGGRGSATGTLVGTLFIGILANLLQLNGVDFYVGLGLEGPILILAVYLQSGRAR